MRSGTKREWNARYQRRWTARQRHSLIKARLSAGLDLHTGMYPAEVERLAQLQVWLREAQLAAVARENWIAVETEFDTVVSEACAEVGRADSTQEFRDELGDLLTEAVEARETWKAAAGVNSPIVEDDGNPQAEKV